MIPLGFHRIKGGGGSLPFFSWRRHLTLHPALFPLFLPCLPEPGPGLRPSPASTPVHLAPPAGAFALAGGVADAIIGDGGCCPNPSSATLATGVLGWSSLGMLRPFDPPACLPFTGELLDRLAGPPAGETSLFLRCFFQLFLFPPSSHFP